jgi:hypothetical protein
MIDFFSDREIGNDETITETITFTVINAIFALFENYKLSISYHFPIKCQDGNGRIFDFDETTFISLLLGYIPNFPSQALKNKRIDIDLYHYTIRFSC